MATVGAETEAYAHVLVVSYPEQGHINPMLSLARELLLRSRHVQVTFVTSDRAKNRMIKAAAAAAAAAATDTDINSFHVRNDRHGGRSSSTTSIGFEVYSDGLPPDFDRNTTQMSISDIDQTIGREGTRTLQQLLAKLRTQGRPATYIIYGAFLHWVVDVAHAAGMPCAAFWMQSCSVMLAMLEAHRLRFAAEAEQAMLQAINDAFEGTPGGGGATPVLQDAEDLPSFLRLALKQKPDEDEVEVCNRYRGLLTRVMEQLQQSTAEPVRCVVANFTEALEAGPLARVLVHDSALPRVLAVGPLLLPRHEDDTAGHMWRAAAAEECAAWLDTSETGSVVYVSFGSMVAVAKEQLHEVAAALRDCGHRFLWVVRPGPSSPADAAAEVLPEGFLEETRGRGMVVPWAAQRSLLRHAAVGAFVSHCGWNSTLETLGAGVPLVCVPQSSDQSTNAALVCRAWKTGLQARADERGVVNSAELRRCIGVVMKRDSGGGGGEGELVRENVCAVRDMVGAAIASGGSSHANLESFLQDILSSSAVSSSDSDSYIDGDGHEHGDSVP